MAVTFLRLFYNNIVPLRPIQGFILYPSRRLASAATITFSLNSWLAAIPCSPEDKFMARARNHFESTTYKYRLPLFFGQLRADQMR